MACLAIAGIPFFSGFFSKDEILAACFAYSPAMGWFMSGVAALTAFYMFRLYYNIFWGRPAANLAEMHEAPAAMTVPLVILASITCVAGFIPFGEFVSSDGLPYRIVLDGGVAATSVVLALAGIGLATWFYADGRQRIPDRLAAALPRLHRAAANRFYIDNAWLFVTRRIIFDRVSAPLAWFDRHAIDGALDALARGAQGLSFVIRKFQSGNVQEYALVFLLGVLVITALAVFI